MKINATKVNGTKNHFIIIYDKTNNKALHQKENVQKICNFSQSKRIDGLLILSNDNKHDFKMDYYNNDGTWETMCANGARCAALYMSEYHITKNTLQFLAGDGLHEAEIINNKSVRLKMTPPKYCSKEISLCNITGFHIDSGAAHFVLNYPQISDQEVKRLGAQIRYDKIFTPRGINVNFYEVISPNELSVKTYEKGIEDLMMSCGSGSVACAYHLSKTDKIQSPTTINIPGGTLKIEFNNDWNDVWLTGHTELEYEMEINI